MLEGAQSDPIFAVMLRPSESRKAGGTFFVDPGKLEGANIDLKMILSFAYGVSQRLLEGPDTLLKTRYDFCVLLPQGATGDVELLRSMVERAFALKVRREPREVDAVVLKSTRARQDGPDRMSTLVRVLETRFKRIVVNETGFELCRHFEFPQEEADLIEALQSRLGNDVSYAKRTVESLVVESLTLPTYRMR
jgi:hypothetical protein